MTNSDCSQCHGLGWYIENPGELAVSAGHMLHLRELYERLGESITITTCKHPEEEECV